MKILFIPCRSNKDIMPAVKKAAKKIEAQQIGIITTSQHLHQLEEAKSFLEEKGKTVVFSGQAIGCEKISSGADAFLYIGSGRFHPLNIAIRSGKPVILANPYSSEADEISRQEITLLEKRKKSRLMRAAAAQTFGILVSTKPGQENMALASELREKINANGKSAFLLAGNEINPRNLLGFEMDTFVNTACPRIVEDEFEKPVINPDELGIILGTPDD